MRFIIREQDFEVPIAAGRFRYELDGEPNGDSESWRMTEVADNYRFLRVDIDPRGTSSDQGLLYHLLINANGALERLKFRVLSMEKSFQADISYDDNAFVATGEFDGQRFEDELTLKDNFVYYFPSVLGLALLVHKEVIDKGITAVTFDQYSARFVQQDQIKIIRQSQEVIHVGRQTVNVRPYLIAWPDREHRLWLDKHDFPVKANFGNEQLAVETQYIRYRETAV